MRHLAFILILITSALQAQSNTSKRELKSIFKETLRKSRNAVSTARNEWRYDNTNDDYSQNDTIILNSARSYKMDFCNGIGWSFYENEKCVLENFRYCNEPPTKLVSKKEDFITLKIKEENGQTYIEQYNLNGLFDKFKVLEVLRNKPLGNGEAEFDYTLKLVRIKV